MTLTVDILKEIENQVGDSWYILDSNKFTSNYHNLLKTFNSFYPNTQIAYSYKTNYTPNICKIVNKEGGYAEVVSEMEYDLAIKVGVDPLKIVVNGPYKPFNALEKFLINGSIVNLDSYTEFYMLKQIEKKHPNNTFNIGVRCNFELGDTPISRFGFDVTDSKFDSIIEYFAVSKNINFEVLHCHYPNRDVSLFEDRVDNMIELYNRVSKYVEPKIIDIGGGLGGNLDEFVKKQLPFETAEYIDYAKVIGEKLSTSFKHKKVKPILMIEPGTALVADAMKFVCKVIDIKNIRGHHIAITSGSKVNYQPMASQLLMPLTVYSVKDNNISNNYSSIDISGYTCMENDYLFKGYSGDLKIGDYLIFDNVGSYSIVFKPPFILPNVPVITFANNKVSIVKDKETLEDVFQTFKFN